MGDGQWNREEADMDATTSGVGLAETVFEVALADAACGGSDASASLGLSSVADRQRTGVFL